MANVIIKQIQHVQCSQLFQSVRKTNKMTQINWTDESSNWVCKINFILKLMGRTKDTFALSPTSYSFNQQAYFLSG